MFGMPGYWGHHMGYPVGSHHHPIYGFGHHYGFGHYRWGHRYW